ncbi:MAG: Gfo/Idh/MocA family oxidoreductase [Bacteroidales bacterium]|nr:Gfo/Idh/MocA family oxidoreductase [Bacteroidales bacterium]
MKDVIHVGLFSYGMSGRLFHAPFLHISPKFSIKKILQRSASDARIRYPYVEIARTPDELYHDPEIDLIVVNTPDHTHYEFARDALKAGKHVIVEKPFVLDIEKGEALIELADRMGKKLTVYQNRRWEGDFLTVQRVIEQHLLGRLVEYDAHFDRFRNTIRDSWKENPDNKTSVLYNLGSHLIDQALILFGMPEGVFADIRTQRTGARIDDAFDLLLIYPDVKVVLKSSYLVREPGPRFRLNGTEGSYVKYGTDPQEEALQAGHMPDEPDWGRESEENWGLINTTINGMHIRGKVETFPGCYQEFFNNLYEAIVSGKELAVKPTESLNGIRIIRAAYKSCSKKAAVEL